MKSTIRHVNNNGHKYDVLAVVCPGCQELPSNADRLAGGLLMIPVEADDSGKAWGWDDNLEAPTLTPSIVTRIGDKVCHSHLTDGVWNFLSDCDHSMAGQQVPMVDLPEWFSKEDNL